MFLDLFNAECALDLFNAECSLDMFNAECSLDIFNADLPPEVLAGTEVQPGEGDLCLTLHCHRQILHYDGQRREPSAPSLSFLPCIYI